MWSPQSGRLICGSVGVLFILTVSLVALGIARQQSEDLTEQVVLPAFSPPLPTIPSLESPPPPEPIDPKRDPLFLEIQKMILNGNSKPPLVPPPNMPSESLGGQPPSDGATVSSTRWHAVESILAAARLLEQDIALSLQKNDMEQAIKTGDTIKRLRHQAMELLPSYERR